MNGGVLVINLNERAAECCICGKEVVDCRTGIPMYEGIPVRPDFQGEWGGFDSCQECYDRYEAGEMEMWGNDELMRIQSAYRGEDKDASAAG